MEECYNIRHIMVITSKDIVQHAMKIKGLMFIVLWAFQQAVSNHKGTQHCVQTCAKSSYTKFFVLIFVLRTINKSHHVVHGLEEFPLHQISIYKTSIQIVVYLVKSHCTTNLFQQIFSLDDNTLS